MFAICGGLMRTGSIAMWQIMSEIAEYAGKPAPMLGTDLNDVIKIWRQERFESDPLLVTKLHLYEDALDRYVPQIGVVLTIRDLRDVAVSLMHYRGDSFDTIMHSRSFKNWVNSYNSWYSNVPAEQILEVKYEEFIANRSTTIERVARFMGIELEERSIGHIDNKWSLAANLRRSQADYDWRTREYMSQRHIYSMGQSLWQKELTEEQVAIVMQGERLEWMEQHGYE